jgi:16S rRNA (cytosine967-C5)-methyltransferase
VSRPARGWSQQKPSERRRTTDPARFAAFRVMRAVADGAYANLELPKILRERGVRGRDAAFATELAYGAIRLQGRYDPIIAAAADRPVAAVDAVVLDVLRLGAHQLLGMRVPAHAAVDETVGLARRVAGAGAGGFANAVMRRIGERSLEEWKAVVLPTGDPIGRLAVEYSHPAWVVKALRAALLGHGASTAGTVDADLEALLASNNAAPRVSLIARPGLATVAELTGRGAVPSGLSPFGATLSSGDPGAIPAVREGRAAVQDEGSQLVVLALASAEVLPATPGKPADGGEAAEPAYGTDGTEPAYGTDGPEQVHRRDGAERWLDLCAGPGGKAGLLASLAIGRGAEFVANEVSPHRADLVRGTLRPAIALAAERGLRVEVRTADGREVGALEPGRYQRVLVDAPCTGLGALRRRPEARWRRSPSDLPALGRLQRELLISAIDATGPGGVVGYATCSPHLGETTFVVRDILKRRDDVEQLDARPLFRGADGAQLEHLGEGPSVQLWPHLHGTDAMFFALLRKRLA